MKLLICTQAADKEDPVLGFFHQWIQEFALRAEQVTVICLRKGAYDFPANVSVHSLGKEHGRVSRLVYACRFWCLAWRHRGAYDAVFVHMNTEYVLLGGALWRLLRKRIALWYVHQSTTLRLRLAVWLAHHVLTASRESFPLTTAKLSVMGHGIPVESYVTKQRPRSSQLRIVTIGRVSHTKRIQEMIATVRELHRQGIPCTFTIIGSPATTADRRYSELLQTELASDPLRDSVRFLGPVPHNEVPTVLGNYDIFLNLSRTESLDKAVLEALAGGVPVVTTNTAFQPMLEPYGLFVSEASPVTLAQAILRATEVDVSPLVQEVHDEHSLSKLIARILGVFHL